MNLSMLLSALAAGFSEPTSTSHLHSVTRPSKRVGGSNYQVPREVSPKRAQALAIRWIVGNARKKKGMPMARRLSTEFVDACNNTGASVQWKENVHKMAEANKAYSHFNF